MEIPWHKASNINTNPKIGARRTIYAFTKKIVSRVIRSDHGGENGIGKNFRYSFEISSWIYSSTSHNAVIKFYCYNMLKPFRKKTWHVKMVNYA